MVDEYSGKEIECFEIGQRIGGVRVHLARSGVFTYVAPYENGVCLQIGNETERFEGIDSMEDCHKRLQEMWKETSCHDLDTART